MQKRALSSALGSWIQAPESTPCDSSTTLCLECLCSQCLSGASGARVAESPGAVLGGLWSGNGACSPMSHAFSLCDACPVQV
jgi:hypothetical protein